MLEKIKGFFSGLIELPDAPEPGPFDLAGETLKNLIEARGKIEALRARILRLSGEDRIAISDDLFYLGESIERDALNVTVLAKWAFDKGAEGQRSFLLF